MTTKQYMKERKKLLDEMECVKLPINKRYTELTKKFIVKNIPYKIGKVYEIVENAIKRKGFKRIIAYDTDVLIMAGSPIIRIAGWWLDENDTPAKWETMVVFGVSNNAVLKLSENQKNNKVPLHLH